MTHLSLHPFKKSYSVTDVFKFYVELPQHLELSQKSRMELCFGPMLEIGDTWRTQSSLVKHTTAPNFQRPGLCVEAAKINLAALLTE